LPAGSGSAFVFSYTESISGRSEMNFNLRTGDTVVVP
jgi:hypothetical protein